VSLQWGIGRLIARTLVALPVDARPGQERPDAATLERERRERLGVARTFYYAAAAVLQEDGHLGFLHTHVNAGLSLLGDDAVLLMYRATVRQAFADPRLQTFARPRSVVGTGTVERAMHLASGPIGLTARPQQTSFELDQAGRDLRRALELDPQLVEAHIRLAHVLADKGRHDEAATLLRPAIAPTLPAFLEYYGALVLGRSEERLGRMAEARAAYERAQRRFPDAQVPRVALSRLALIEGRASEAVAGLVAALSSRGPDAPEDPWWWYFRSHAPDAGALIAAMREAVR
jgi:tetratricopeptide (TPR) repeat protein